MGADVIKEPFAVINCDDFYGRDSFQVMGKFLSALPADSKNVYSMVGFRVGNTLSESGTVSRGICSTDAKGLLTSVVERTKIQRLDGEVKYIGDDGEWTATPDTTPVSMNFWGFTPDYFAYSQEFFKTFLSDPKNMENLKALTEAVCCVAREAGHFLKEERKSFRREVVQEKHAHDYVSYVDKASEKKVVSALRKLLPEAGFIAEEGSAAYSDETYCWVVDPLDGTTNYIHDNAPYCVSIALRDKQSLLLGVVYEPCRDECFYAWKGGGAYVNGERLRVSLVSELKDAFVVTELPYNFEQYARTGEHLIHELYGKVAGIRMNGSAALALCYVAAGRFDAWLEAFIGKWDFSAAALMVLEAGGKVTDFLGNENFIEGHHIIATNGPLHPLFLRLVREALPF